MEIPFLTVEKGALVQRPAFRSVVEKRFPSTMSANIHQSQNYCPDCFAFIPLLQRFRRPNLSRQIPMPAWTTACLPLPYRQQRDTTERRPEPQLVHQRELMKESEL